MDSLIAAAGRALAVGDALAALKRVALREDPPALALRGIAMAQLGDYPRARELLRRAARAFGAREAIARARCVVAEAETALAMRDLGGSPRTLAEAAAVLAARGDRANAWQAQLIAARRALLLGRVDEAAAVLATLAGTELPPALAAVAALAEAELALRALRTASARAALDRAETAARRAGVAPLLAEAADARAALGRIAARLIRAGHEQPLRLDQVEALLAADMLVVDACRRGWQAGDGWRSLARRPVLFALLRALAEAWPEPAERGELIARVFRTRDPDDSHRSRLRVEIGRLRALLAPSARIEATAGGFVLRPRSGRGVAMLAPPIDGDSASLLALLADGAAWSSSALAQALGASQRSVQRALAELETEGRVRSVGRARAQRWLAPPLLGFTTILLLPAALPAE
ncbi:helix-turn-helix domain-containing protein [Lysobacter firmicutimachus]|uniref:Helix-turn-helix domain-containing protein n=1 Tax=Lysobacter firmicutimachus TaxID=1792846 RepID=A0AAU8MZ85_9GAMM